MSKARRLFSDDDLEAVRRAIDEAEGTTSGELVPYVVGRCDDYPEAVWKAAALGAIAAAVVCAVVDWWRGGSWGGNGVAFGLAVAATAVGAALLAQWLDPLRRRLVPAERLQERAEERAAEAFLQEEIFATKERTGILIFLAIFEHRVVVLGDSGINEKVEQAEWQEIVDHLVGGIRAKQPAQALVEAIASCGRLLTARQVERRDGDVNELGDGVRFSGD